MNKPPVASMLLSAAVLAGCASAPPAQVPAHMPAQWHRSSPASELPLPHDGKLQQLLQWWSRWDDPLLVDLIAAAQNASPTLASAAAKIAQARAGAVGMRSAMLPQLDAQAGVQRTPASTQPMPGVPPNTIVHLGQAGLQLQWELDLFGGLRHASRAAQARLAGAQAQWHEARVSLAADTANQYFALRACQASLNLAGRDAVSRADTAKLTGDLTRAGFAAPATLALTQAGAAQAQAQRQQTEAQCTAAIKGLGALTAIDEDDLRQRLANPAGRAPALAVDNVPAHVLNQRPDVFAAAQAVAAASGDVGQADAQRYPRLGLSGNIGRLAVQIPQFDSTSYSSTWSVGPLAISLPLFDGGRRNANLQASKAQYEAAASQYRAVVRNAVREVETALSDLHSARQRSSQTDTAVRGFEKAFVAANAKYKAGMGSLLELEDARRNYLQAQMAQVALQQQARNAAVALYRALGGGWQPATNPTTADKYMVAAGEMARKQAGKRGSKPAATSSAAAPAASAAPVANGADRTDAAPCHDAASCAAAETALAVNAAAEAVAAAEAAQRNPRHGEALSRAAILSDRAVTDSLRQCGNTCQATEATLSSPAP